jgi:hypothetical protein
MDREELLTLHAALGAVLALPDSVRELLVKWLTPAAAKPNGRDPHPPVPLATPRPTKAKSTRRMKPTPAQAAEQRLLTAMRQNPGLSVIALANAAGSGRSATGERLRQMALRGMVEKDITGRWKLKGEELRPSLQGAEAGPPQPSPD